MGSVGAHQSTTRSGPHGRTPSIARSVAWQQASAQLPRSTRVVDSNDTSSGFVAAAAPTSCAAMNPPTSAGRIPANVLLAARASVTAGLAKHVDAVNLLDCYDRLEEWVALPAARPPLGDLASTANPRSSALSFPSGEARRSTRCPLLSIYFGLDMSFAHPIRYSRTEYVAFEASSNVRHEFLDGQIYGMAGGTPEHAALAAAVIGLLFGQLRGSRCRSYDADLRVRVLETGLATYPDVTIVCGPPQRDPEDDNAVTNPTLLVEVTSPSTESYDRGEKFRHYRRIASLRQYVIVSHRERTVDVWTRDDAGGWQQLTARDGERAALDAIGAALDVDALYEGLALAH